MSPSAFELLHGWWVARARRDRGVNHGPAEALGSGRDRPPRELAGRKGSAAGSASWPFRNFDEGNISPPAAAGSSAEARPWRASPPLPAPRLVLLRVLAQGSLDIGRLVSQAVSAPAAESLDPAVQSLRAPSAIGQGNECSAQSLYTWFVLPGGLSALTEPAGPTLHRIRWRRW
jgi:hypothetical protein